MAKDTISASDIGKEIAQFVYENYFINKDSYNTFVSIAGGEIKLSKEQCETLSIWSLAHSINPATNLFNDDISLIIQGEALRHFSKLANIDSKTLLNQYHNYSKYFYENYSKENSLIDEYWVLDEIGLDSLKQDPYFLTGLKVYIYKTYSGILKLHYLDLYKVVV